MDPILFPDRTALKPVPKDADTFDLFAPPPSPSEPAPPHNGTPTSADAAASVAHDTNRLRQLVLDAITARGRQGATREELEHLANLDGNTVRPRVKELLERGAVMEHGQRPTASGRNAAVLVARVHLVAGES